MGRNRHGALPKITVHPRSGHARVRYNGKEIWLGKNGSPEAQQKYDQIIHEIVSNRLQVKPQPVDALATQEQSVQSAAVKGIDVEVVTLDPRAQSTAITVAEMCSRFFVYAEKEYRHPDGKQTGTLGDIKTAIRAMRQFDDMSAASFGPVLLEELMHALASEKVRCVKNGGKIDYRPRKTINRTIKTIRRIFGWAVTRELIPPEKYIAMKSMKLLKAYRTNARELKKIQHVPDSVIEQTLPHLPAIVSDMVRFQRLTGVRPGELCLLRPEDVDRSEITWLWRLSDHKNAWRDHTREIHIGPKGRAILEPYLERPADQNCFLSSESELIRNRERRSKRASPMTPSHRARRKKSAQKYRKVTAYTVDSYRRAISRACEKNNIPAWSPNQLRHTAATEARAKHGLDAAQLRLGHKHASTTEIYADLNRQKAAELAEQLG
ncbi:MAG: tyrosine-type recombinase/integrase [Pirellulales bacterium]